MQNLISQSTRFSFYVLAVFLPVQTLIAQFVVNRLGLSEYLNFWKEVLVIFIIFGLVFETVSLLKKNSLDVKILIKIGLPLILILTMTIIILFNSFLLNKTELYVFILGFRFELFWLWFFAVVACFLNLKKELSLSLEIKFRKGLLKSVLTGFGLVSIVVILGLGLGQTRVLGFFGFGIARANSLVSTAPTCHVIDFGQSDCRLSGTFSTPNHFSGYLLLILPVLLAGFLDARKLKKSKESLFHLVLIIFNFSFIFLSFSRFALLGLIVFLSFAVIFHLHKKYLKEALSKVLVIASLLVPIFIGIVAINLDPEISSRYLPSAIAKPSSTIEHYRRTTASLEILKQNPNILITGFGLGSSGPSAKPNYVNISNNPIIQKYAFIAFQKGLIPDDLLIPENWYLQLVLNGGLIYTFLYLWLIFYVFKDFGKLIFSKFKSDLETQIKVFYLIGFFAIIVGNLFLHLWENQTIALYWSIIFVMLNFRGFPEVD